MFECDICRKTYNSSFKLRAHKRRHTSKNLGRYKCDVCEKHFVQQSSLNTHKRIHTGEKPYECDVCQRKFADLSTFNKHIRTHTGEKPYSCPICNREFSQSGNMLRHKENVHKENNLAPQSEQLKSQDKKENNDPNGQEDMQTEE